ncbi:MAG: hypothetical protein ACREK5_00595, partial [Gemmatimonadota bacterium]
GRRFPRRAVWLPLAAAAAIAALLIWAPREPQAPEGSARLTAESAGSAPSEVGADPALPVIVEASRAAEEVLQAAGEDEVVNLLDAPLIDAVDADGSLVTDEFADRTELEAAFADLPTEDREAILDELASVSLDLPRP